MSARSSRWRAMIPAADPLKLHGHRFSGRERRRNTFLRCSERGRGREGERERGREGERERGREGEREREGEMTASDPHLPRPTRRLFRRRLPRKSLSSRYPLANHEITPPFTVLFSRQCPAFSADGRPHGTHPVSAPAPYSQNRPAVVMKPLSSPCSLDAAALISFNKYRKECAQVLSLPQFPTYASNRARREWNMWEERKERGGWGGKRGRGGERETDRINHKPLS